VFFSFSWFSQEPEVHMSASTLASSASLPTRVIIVDCVAETAEDLFYMFEESGLNPVAYLTADAFLRDLSEIAGYRCCLVVRVAWFDSETFDLHEELKRRGLDIPVVYFMEYGTLEEFHQAVELGAVGYFEDDDVPYSALDCLVFAMLAK
jgi:FixJ family two-component response regulator